jgi:hypothetical protein
VDVDGEYGLDTRMPVVCDFIWKDREFFPGSLEHCCSVRIFSINFPVFAAVVWSVDPWQQFIMDHFHVGPLPCV